MRYEGAARCAGLQAGDEAPSQRVTWTSAAAGSKVTAVRYRRTGGSVPARG